MVWNPGCEMDPQIAGKKLEGGKVKVRFIVDMLRSGVNSLATTGERIVLPRGADLVGDILDLVAEGGQVELFTADITDAFLNLTINEAERGFAVISIGHGEYAAYKGVPFGFAPAPLL